MFDLQSVVEDYIQDGSDSHEITVQVYNLIEKYAYTLDMLYIIDIPDPNREELDLSFQIHQSINELQFNLFQLFNKHTQIHIFDIQNHHLTIYIPLIYYMSKLNKLQLDNIYTTQSTCL